MGRFRRERFNPWTNLNKMLNQKKPKVVEEEKEVSFKSEVGTSNVYYQILLLFKDFFAK